MKDAVVKVDAELLEKIEKFVESHKYQYSSNKQVVNLAILEFLNSKSLNIKSKKGEKGGIK